jgi:hypothetical protein
LGNYAFGDVQNFCDFCKKEIPQRNWLTYFSSITDVKILRALDIWIRKRIYNTFFQKTKTRLTKQKLLQFDIPSLEKQYYHIKKELNKKKEYCFCQSSQEGYDDSHEHE